jgi:protein involved in polysaccharide export with SLBB domain
MNYENPLADMMKKFSEFKAPTMASMPSMDVTQLMNVGRRNAEAFSAAGQALAESSQAITRRQAELVRAQVAKSLKTAKEQLVNGSPEINTTKQVEVTGEVKYPGSYPMPAKVYRLTDLIAEAGGLNALASKELAVIYRSANDIGPIGVDLKKALRKAGIRK